MKKKNRKQKCKTINKIKPNNSGQRHDITVPIQGKLLAAPVLEDVLCGNLR